MKKNNLIRSRLLYLAGLAMCIIPPVAATLLYFPAWTARGGEYMLSGIGVLLVLLSAVPMYKSISRCLRSAASYTLWLILFLIFFLLSRIADELTVISFFGTIGNIVGAVFFKISKKLSTDMGVDHEKRD